MTLEQIWGELKGRVAPNSSVPFWSAGEGYLGDSFHIVSVKGGHIEVAQPGDEHAQKVPDADFVAVLGLWNDYVDGKLGAAAIRNSTRFSKYVVSILHSLEQPQPQA